MKALSLESLEDGWGALGEIIRTIFKQHMGGAMGKKGQPEWMGDGPSVVHCRN
jgi:hypothetical protein